MHCMPITVTALATVVSCTHRRVGPGMKQRTAESGGASAVGHGQDARHGVRSRSMLRQHFRWISFRDFWRNRVFL